VIDEHSCIDCDAGTVASASGVTLALLQARASYATICPSEVVRTMVKQGMQAKANDWRSLMPLVHEAVDALIDQGNVSLSWKGRSITKRAGPYRIGLKDPADLA
jgi:hypothetical protein